MVIFSPYITILLGFLSPAGLTKSLRITYSIAMYILNHFFGNSRG